MEFTRWVETVSGNRARIKGIGGNLKEWGAGAWMGRTLKTEY